MKTKAEEFLIERLGETELPKHRIILPASEIADMLQRFSDQETADLKIVNSKQSELIERQKDYINWVNKHTPDAKKSRRGDNMLTDIEIINTALKLLQSTRKEKPKKDITDAYGGLGSEIWTQIQ